MRANTSLTDGLSDLRLRMGFPPGAPLLLRLALIPSLSVMLCLRHRLGVRLVGTPRLVMLLLALLLWGLPPSLLLADELRPPHDWWKPMLIFTIAAIVLGIEQRITRWTSRLKGERLNSLSLGVSWLSEFLPQNTAERYVDPLLCIAIGVALCAAPLDLSFAILGSWLVLSGVMLYAIEKYLHELQLNQEDELLSAEAHQFRFGTLTAASPASAPSSSPVATGIDDALAASIARRRQALAISAQPVEATAKAALAPPESAIAAASQFGTTEALPSQADDQRRVASDMSPAPPSPVSQAAPITAAERAAPRPAPDYGALAGLAFMALFLAAVGLHFYGESSAASAESRSERVLNASSTQAPTETLDALFDRAYDGLRDANGDPAKEAAATRLLATAAERGHATAQSMLGTLYLLGGGGVRQDSVQALVWLRRAAAQGEARALYRLGGLYEEGAAGLKASDVEAFTLYRQAAEQDYADAQAALGHMYLSGRGGVSRNDREAVAWFVKAYRGGSQHGRSVIKVLVDSARKGRQVSVQLLEEHGVDWRRELLTD